MDTDGDSDDRVVGVFDGDEDSSTVGRDDGEGLEVTDRASATEEGLEDALRDGADDKVDDGADDESEDGVEDGPPDAMTDGADEGDGVDSTIVWDHTNAGKRKRGRCFDKKIAMVLNSDILVLCLC